MKDNSTVKEKTTKKPIGKDTTKKPYKLATDWKMIQQEYIESDLSHRQLAEKHNIGIKAIQKHACDEKWLEKRKQFKEEFSKALVQKTIDTLSDKAAEVNYSFYSSYGKALKLINNILDNPQKHLMVRGVISLDKMEKLTRSINNIQNGQMMACGMVAEAEMKKLELMARKLDIEEAKIVNPDENVSKDTSFISAVKGKEDDLWDETMEKGV